MKQTTDATFVSLDVMAALLPEAVMPVSLTLRRRSIEMETESASLRMIVTWKDVLNALGQMKNSVTLVL
jgi:hypothetical protein